MNVLSIAFNELSWHVRNIVVVRDNVVVSVSYLGVVELVSKHDEILPRTFMQFVELSSDP